MTQSCASRPQTSASGDEELRYDSLEFVASWAPAGDTGPVGPAGVIEPGWDATWCVDFGDRMDSMTKMEIWMGLAAGRLEPHQRVWREGRAWWLPIAEVDELTGRPGGEAAELEPEPSDAGGAFRAGKCAPWPEVSEPPASLPPKQRWGSEPAEPAEPAPSDDEVAVPLRLVKLGLRQRARWAQSAVWLVCGLVATVAAAVGSHGLAARSPIPSLRPVAVDVGQRAPQARDGLRASLVQPGARFRKAEGARD